MFPIVQCKNIIRISCLAREAIMLKMNLCLRFFWFFLYSQSKSETPQICCWTVCVSLDSEISAASYGPESVPRGHCWSYHLCPLGLPPFCQGSRMPSKAPEPHLRPQSHQSHPFPSDATARLVSSFPQLCPAQANRQIGDKETIIVLWMPQIWQIVQLLS